MYSFDMAHFGHANALRQVNYNNANSKVIE